MAGALLHCLKFAERAQPGQEMGNAAPDIDPRFTQRSGLRNATDTGAADHGRMRSLNGTSIAVAGGTEGRPTAPVLPSIALVAHDKKKGELLDWARENRSRLASHEIFATGGTGSMLHSELGLAVARLQSGPLGMEHPSGVQPRQCGLPHLVLPLTPRPCARVGLATPVLRSVRRRLAAVPPAALPARNDGARLNARARRSCRARPRQE